MSPSIYIVSLKRADSNAGAEHREYWESRTALSSRLSLHSLSPKISRTKSELRRFQRVAKATSM